jgi:hypothetical protein
MSKPVKTEAELIAMAKAELKVHADCPDGMVIGVLRSDDSREFRASADAATRKARLLRMRRDAGADRRPPRHPI